MRTGHGKRRRLGLWMTAGAEDEQILRPVSNAHLSPASTFLTRSLRGPYVRAGLRARRHAERA
jgi:hypothetical protein